MLLVDLEARAIYEDRELLEIFDRDATYAQRVIEDEVLAAAPALPTLDAGALLEVQRGFGYTREDVRMIPAANGQGRQGRRVVDGRRHAARVFGEGHRGRCTRIFGSDLRR